MTHKKNVKIKPLTDNQRAYLAGMIDGEGSICITKRNDHSQSRLGYCYRPVVHVASTHNQVLNTLQRWTGLGRTNLFDDARPNRKARWQWMIWSKQAAQLVEAVLPFLIIKKRQAILFLKFVRAVRGNGGNGRSGISDRKWILQDNIYQQMKKLNL